MRRIVGLAFLALFCLAAWLAPLAPVKAAPASQTILYSGRNDGWSAIRISEGCYLIFFRDGLVDGWGGYRDPQLDVSANAECAPNGLAEGDAWVEFIWHLDTGEPVMKQIEGTAHLGVLDGNATSSIGDRDGDGWALRDLGDARNPSPSFYRQGCEFYDDADGQFTIPADETCQPMGAQAMIQQLIDAGLIGGGAPGAAPPPAPAPAPARTDVWGKCISLKAEEPVGIQDEWSLNNRCNEPVIVRYCFKPNTGALGDPKLCAHREYATQEIRANGKLDFAFSLIPEGQAMADGTLAGPPGLTVLGFACTDGVFPDAYFEDGQFKSLGC